MLGNGRALYSNPRPRFFHWVVTNNIVRITCGNYRRCRTRVIIWQPLARADNLATIQHGPFSALIDTKYIICMPTVMKNVAITGVDYFHTRVLVSLVSGSGCNLRLCDKIISSLNIQQVNIWQFSTMKRQHFRDFAFTRTWHLNESSVLIFHDYQYKII